MPTVFNAWIPKCFTIWVKAGLWERILRGMLEDAYNACIVFEPFRSVSAAGHLRAQYVVCW